MEEKDEQQPQTEAPVVDEVKSPQKRNKLAKLLATRKGKVTAVIVAFVLVVASLLFIPPLRNVSLGLLIKKQISVKVVDSVSSRPVANAKVLIDGSESTTGADGVAKVNGVSATPHKLEVSKPNYKSSTSDVDVSFFASPSEYAIKLEATGQQVVLTLTNAITKDPLADADISFGNTSSKTGQDGKATIVLPYEKNAQQGVIKKAGFVDKTLKVTAEAGTPEQALNAALAPEGSVAFLSKKSGTIDVMRANLDGTGAKVLVKGTGNEQEGETVLLSTRDWKYSALLARRDGSRSKLYLVEKSTGTLTLIDEGNVNFTLVGWSGHRFVYQIYRNDKKDWESKHSAIKAYDADTKTLHVVDETAAFRKGGNYGQESYSGVYILDNEIVFATTWYFGDVYGYEYYGNDKQNGRLVSVTASSLVKRTVQNFSITEGDALSTRAYEAQALYLQYVKDYNYDKGSYYEYEKGKVEQKSDVTANKYDQPYPTYLISPTGKKTFWYDERDGKNVLFIGDKYGENQKTIAARSDYKPYGWFGANDDYVLISKDDSELFVAAIDKLKDATYQPLKITNYHKPRLGYFGYGYGYGGV